MVKTIYVVRHALRANFDPPPTGIDGDVAISQEGHEQTAELTAHVQTLEPRIQRIYSSPFYRCLQTIQPGAKELGLPIQVETGLGEFYRLERPTHPVPLPASKSKDLFPSINTDYESKISIPHIGESREQLWVRVGKIMSALIEESQDVDTVLFATHAAVKIAIADVMTGQLVRAGTASMDRYELVEEDGKSTWKLTANGDTSYLSKGEQMHWSFEMHHEAGSAADEVSRKGLTVEGLDGAEVAADSTTAAENTQSSEEQVNVFVPLDLSGQAMIPTSGTLQVVDLEREKPLVQINQTVYEGRWQDLVGTEIYTTPQGEYIGKTRQRIVLEPIQTEKSKAEKLKISERVKQIDEEKARSMDIDSTG